MSKYHGSPWGYMRGKLFDTVGGYWKGINWNRVRVYPTQRGTLELYRMLKEGLIPPERFSYKQFNIRRLVVQVLGWLGRTNLSTLIYPVWELLCSKRKLAMTGTNLFVKRNAARMFNSMPDKNLEYDPDTNAPDMKTMLVSDGDLEPADVFNATYNTITGDLEVSWKKDILKNGKLNDFAYVMCYLRPIVDEEWYPNGYLYGKAELPEPPLPVRTRDDESMVLPLPAGLDNTKMTAYLFFKDLLGEIGFSPSRSFEPSAA